MVSNNGDITPKGTKTSNDRNSATIIALHKSGTPVMDHMKMVNTNTPGAEQSDEVLSCDDETISTSLPSPIPHAREPLTLWAYRQVTKLGGGIAKAALKRRQRKGKEDQLRLPERTGIASIDRPHGALAWIHGASVGESLSVLPLVSAIAEQRPDIHVLVTTGTTTSASLMIDRLPPNAFHQYIPVDYPPYVTRFLDHWRPDAAIFVESEFWPNLIHEVRNRTGMMAIVNGRISPTSYVRWKRRPHSIQHLLSAFDLIIAQDGDNAERLRELSDRDVMMFGNLKNAADPLPADPQSIARLSSQIEGRPLWLAASTHPQEEEMIFDAHRLLRTEFRKILTVLAPRHPDRGAELAALAKEKGLKVSRRSIGEAIVADTDVYIADTLGELGIFYRLCDIALVGGG